MDDNKPLIERDEVGIWNRWFLPAAAGAAILIIAFATATQGIRPQPWQMGLFTLGILVGGLDGFGTPRVVSYATIRGPQQREDEANARFYVWQRARRRYVAALLLSVSVVLSMMFFTSEAAQVAGFAVPFGLYWLLWGFDIVRSLREAKALFPPPVR